MYIYIDESGIFAPSESEGRWSTVGALVVPDTAVDDVQAALEALKVALSIDIEEEIKRDRPDCSSVPFEKFIKNLEELGCTLHAVSIAGEPLQAERLEEHRKSTKIAINNYVKLKGISDSLSAEACTLIDKLSAQQFSQCILQTFLLCELLEKTIPYYAKISPESLGEFFWEFDRKNIVETDFERVFKMLYIGRVQSASSRRPLPLVLSPERNYGYFIRSFCQSENVADNKGLLDVTNMFGADLSIYGNALGLFNVSKLLENHFKLVDSKDSPGLQVSDLLVSSINRCLKGNYTNNEKMASLLGKLMVNSSKPNARALSLMEFSDTHKVQVFAGNIINLMETSSQKLFSKEFIQNSARHYGKI